MRLSLMLASIKPATYNPRETPSQRQSMSTDIPIDQRLRIIEIYASIQGESTWTGKPCVFVRLAGCNLRCTWCDSEFTFTGGEHRSIADVVDEACSHGINLVEVTGGEPLAQRQALPLMQMLLDRGKTVLLETSGSIDISTVPRGVHIILDLKCPDSGESDANLLSNLDHLRESTEVKFVVASQSDFNWAVGFCQEYPVLQNHELLFSPAYGLVQPSELIDWLMESGLNARFQLQTHKIIWPPDARGV